MYGIRVVAKGAKSDDGTWVTEPGKTYWIANESEGWVMGTMGYGKTDKPCADVKVFKTEADAKAFASKWWVKFHPWYAAPKSMEIIPLIPETKTVIVGYRIAT